MQVLIVDLRKYIIENYLDISEVVEDTRKHRGSVCYNKNQVIKKLRD